MLTTETITDLDGFRALEEEWNELANHAGASVFGTWQWSWHWWQANRKGKKLLVVTARDDARLVALAPFYTASSYLGLPLKVVSFIGTEGTDYLDVLAVPGREDALIRILEHVSVAAKWDAIDLHQLPATSPVVALAERVAEAAGYRCDTFDQDTAYVLALPATWDDFLGSLTKKFRWNVQYYRRRLERDYACTIRLSECDRVAHDMDLFFKLHQKRFLDKKKPGAYLNPRFRAFHNQLAVSLCDAGRLRLYMLELDGVAVAALYGFAFGNSFYYYLGGFEPELGNLSVSTVLIAQSIQDAMAQGLARYDFLRGDEPYKQKWGAVPMINRRVIISRSGARSGLVKKMLAVEHDVAQKAKALLHKA